MDMRMVLGMIAMVALLSPVAVLGLTGSSPSIGSMGITPEDPGTGDDLTCSAVISDSDGDLDTATLRWLVNGITESTKSFGISGSSATVTDTLGSSFTEANDLVECIVTAEDMQGRVTQEDASVRIASGSEACFIDVFGLEVKDDEDIQFRVRNYGHSEVTVTYSVSVGSKIVEEADILVRAEETRLVIVNYPYFIEGGSYQISAWAEAECGDADQESIAFSVPGSCRVDIRDLDVRGGDEITFGLQNTGDLDTDVLYFIYVDGRIVGTDLVHVRHGYESSVTFYYDDFDAGERQDIRVRAESSCGFTDVDEIEYDAEEDCSVDIRDLDVEDDDEISFEIRNRGDTSTRVEYRIYVDGDLVEVDDVRVSGNDEERIRFSYDFFDDFDDGDDVDVRVRTEASCGDTDTERITHTLGGSCSGRYLDSYRCDGRWLERLYRDKDCTVRWVDWQFCSLGCSGGQCIGQTVPPQPPAGSSCGVEIDSFSIPASLQPGGTAYISATVRNTGSSDSDIRVDFFLDGQLLGSKDSYLSPGTSSTKVWNFPISTTGTHRLSVTASSLCGTSKSLQGSLSVTQASGGQGCNYNSVCDSGETWYSCPYDCERPASPPGSTAVEVSPGSLDITQYKSKIISVDVISHVPQDFSLSIEGIPEDWFTTESPEFVDSEKTLYIIVNPKDRGIFDIVVEAKALSEGTTFRQGISLYVAPPEMASFPAGDNITGIIGGLLANNVFIIAVVIIIFVTLLIIGYARLRPARRMDYDVR